MRDFTLTGPIHKLLYTLRGVLGGIDCLVINGAARGADTIAKDAAALFGMEPLTFPAMWEMFGKRAGPLRNTQMLQQAPQIVAAFYWKDGPKPCELDCPHPCRRHSIGTNNMVKQALRAETPVIRYEHEAGWSRLTA